MDSYQQRFGGILRLYGAEALARFQAAHLAVIGIGGVGSWAAEALARSGVGKLSLVDLDDLCLTNTNRQVHALTGTVGKAKVAVMAERIRAINPDCEVVEQHMFYHEKTSGEILDSGIEGVVDAIDAVHPKCHLIAGCRERKLPLVVSGGAGGRRDPARIEKNDLSRTHGDALLNQVRKRLRSDFGFPPGGKKPKPFRIPAVFSAEPPVFPSPDGCVTTTRPEDTPAGLRCDAGYGTATHITATFGLFAAGALLEMLAHEKGGQNGPPSEMD